MTSYFSNLLGEHPERFLFYRGEYNKDDKYFIFTNSENDKVMVANKSFELIDGTHVDDGDFGASVNCFGVSQSGNCWAKERAEVYDSTITGNAVVEPHALVIANSRITGNSYIGKYAIINCGMVHDNASVGSYGMVEFGAKLLENAHLCVHGRVGYGACIAEDGVISTCADYLTICGIGEGTNIITAYRTKNFGVNVNWWLGSMSFEEFRNTVCSADSTGYSYYTELLISVCMITEHFYGGE